MATGEDRRAEQRGGVGALVVAGCFVLRLAALVLLIAAKPALGPAPILLLLVSEAGGAAGQAFAVEGARRRLGDPTPLSWTAAAAGWAGAVLALAEPLKIGARGLGATAASALGSGLLLGWLAAFAVALWAAGVAADDWRRRRFSPWLRVTGTAFALASLAAAVLPPVAALAGLLAVAWWLGLAVALLRRPRSTSG